MDILLKSLDRYRNEGLLALRCGLGGVFIAHGAGKLLGGTERWAQLGSSLGAIGLPEIGPPVIWGFLATITEFLGGILLIAGWLFRPALLALVGTMVVATLYLAVGRNAPFTQWSHPLTVGWVFLSLLLVGPGSFSMDRDYALNKSGGSRTDHE